MARIFKTMLIALFLAGAFTASPAMADRKVGNVIIKDDPTKKNLVIRQGRDTIILRTSPEAARRIEKMIKKNDGRVVFKNRSFTYYPEEYYPYYRNPGAAYYFGRAFGEDRD